jgi:uncharacterized membrane protein YhaH (DUF805 family)
MDIKKCPYCGKTVLAISKVCKHCGKSFEEAQRVGEETVNNNPVTQVPPPPPPRPSQPPPPPPVARPVENQPTESPYNYSSKEMFKRPFSFEGRIRRLEYGLSMIIYLVYASIIGGIIGLMLPYNDSAVLQQVFLVPGYFFMLAQGAKRCHDRDNSGWYQIIPFYGLWMLLADGDAGSNRYGDSPKS